MGENADLPFSPAICFSRLFNWVSFVSFDSFQASRISDLVYTTIGILYFEEPPAIALCP